jgi:hypothetical protein
MVIRIAMKATEATGSAPDTFTPGTARRETFKFDPDQTIESAGTLDLADIA